MDAVPAGMESNSDSDVDDMVHFPCPSSKLAPTSDENPKVDITANSEVLNKDIVSSTHSLSNGNVKTALNTSSITTKNTSRSNIHKKRRCVDTKTNQLLDDFRFAVMQGNLEIVSSFIKDGLFVDSVLKAGWTGLMYASSCGHHEIVRFLLDENADPNFEKDLFTSLMAACASNHDEQNQLKCCQYLLECGASINTQERHLTTPLMFAARGGHAEIVKELLKHEVQLDTHDNKGRTALAWAASKGFGQIVRMLLDKGADPNKVTFGGQTPADLAYDEGHKEVASLLQKGSHQITDKTDSVKDRELPDDVSKPSPKDSSCMPAKENSDLQKYFKPLDKIKCYVKQGELEIFLNGLGLSELINTFDEHQLTFQDILVMTDENLEKMGITQFGARKKILEATRVVHKKEWETSSLPNLKQYISCPEAVAMVANISKHLKYIGSTMIYVRQQIQAQPRILELGQDSSNVHDLIDETKDSIKNATILIEELRFLKLHLDKVQDNVEYIPADLIVETVPKNKTRNKGMIIVVLTIVTITVGGVIFRNSKPITNLISSIPFVEQLNLFHC